MKDEENKQKEILLRWGNRLKAVSPGLKPRKAASSGTPFPAGVGGDVCLKANARPLPQRSP